MTNSGSVSLKILGEQLDFDDIALKINVNPTNIFRKGVVYNKIIGETENDVWYYDIDFDEDKDINNVVGRLIDILYNSKDYIKELSEKVYISLRIAIQTEMAQIYFQISPKVISKLSELNIGLEFSILSFGEVEN